MTGRTVTAIIVVILLVVAGIWAFGRNDVDVATNPNNATTTEDLTGVGGADEGFDPLDSMDTDTTSTDTGDEEELYNDKG